MPVLRMIQNTALLQRQELVTLLQTLSCSPSIGRTSKLTGSRYTSLMDGFCSLLLTLKTVPCRVKILKKDNTHFQRIHAGASSLS